ncbi:class F sortase [uncultured Cellulomonas sp.]|uniref:class F sortase n=1 Tax=uncultured Cellulomonas sp. TaxID=189682 RepID=UPI0026254A7C|nr:class F sortase [uncultured Cellulomonas sp.]
MSDHRRHDGRSRILAAAAVVLAVAGALALVLGLRGGPAEMPTSPPLAASTEGPSDAAGSPPAAAADGSGDRADPVGPGGAARDAAPTAAETAPLPELGPILPASEPVSLTIPAIGVASDTLERLDVGPDGVLPAPTDFALPGWHTRGPNPGQLGPAVIAGHVDGPDGPAVFIRLGELQPGDEVQVGRADGTVATFVIDEVGRYAKADFPTSLVYGNTTDRAEIRLITCGGAFDRSTGHYVDNIVAFGHLVG